MEKQFLFVDAANPTWLVYVSVLVLAVFFRFSRLFTVRNLDVLLILVLSSSLVIASASKNAAPRSQGTAESQASADSEAAADPASSAAAGGPAEPGSSVVPESGAVAAASVTRLQSSTPGSSAPGHPAGDSTPATVSVGQLTDPRPVSSSAEAANGLAAAPLPAAGPLSIAGSQAGTGSQAAASAEPAGGRESREAGAVVIQTAALPAVATPEMLLSEGPVAPPSGPVFSPVYQWSSGILLVLSVLLIIRLMFDEALTRRPRLEQNLNQAGLTFLCIPAFVLLTISVFVIDPPDSTVAAVEQGRALLQRRDVRSTLQPAGEQPPAPTETLIAAGAAGVAQLSGQLPVSEPLTAEHSADVEAWVARILVVVSHTIVVLGLLYIGKHHFSSLQLGLSMSCLYLLLPCTGYHVHQLSHVLPGACLTWAIASYRKPVVAGVLLGLACGTLFFAVFLLPVWAAFYGRRGSMRFGLSLVGVAAILLGCLLLTSSDADSFMNKLVTTMNWTVYRLLDETGSAPETPFGHLFVRIPLAAVFFVMLTAMTVLPRPRNLENLLANSTALVVTAQLWYPDDIGAYVLWYLPLLLLVAFRPRLDRFTPPDAFDRHASPVSQPSTAGAPAAVAMSRLTLYQ